MKTNKLFKTALLLLLAATGTNTAWADGTINIPQVMGSYILIGTTSGGTTTSDGVTITNCKVDNQLSEGSNYYTVGTTNANSTVDFALTVSEAKDYVFGFKTGASGCSATLSLKLLNNSSEEIWSNTATVENTSNWKPTKLHLYQISNLAIGTYTMKITVTSITSGSYAGNWGHFYFHSFDQFQQLPLKGSNTLDVSGMTTNGCNSSDNHEIGSIRNGYFVDNIVFYNQNETAFYNMCLNVSQYKDEYQGGEIKFTITDAFLGTKEIEQTSEKYTSLGDKTFAFSGALTSGLKVIRLDFINTEAGGNYFFNITNLSLYKRSLNENYDYAPVAADGVDVVLTRTLSAGKWSTIMLPFNISATDLGTALGTTVTLAAFTSFSDNSLNFTSADAIAANTPYMIKVSEAVSGAKTINGVNIVTTGNQYVDQNGVRFQGVYASTKMEAGDYFFSNNNLYKATASTKPIKPFRAYFKDVPAGARLMFFDETTGISEVMGNTEKASGIYYDLQGRRIAQPQKGLYIVNGKKVFVK